MDWTTRGMRVRFPAGVRDSFLFQSVETGCRTAQSAVQCVPGVKRPGREPDYSPHRVPRLRAREAVPPFPTRLNGMVLTQFTDIVPFTFIVTFTFSREKSRVGLDKTCVMIHFI